MKKLYKVSKNNNLLLINNLSLKSINDLPKKIVVDLYNQHGALLFRNFKIGIDDIQKFTDKFTKIYANDAGRRKEVENTKHVKTVDEGNKMMTKLGEEFDKTYRQFSATALDLHD